MPHLSTTLSALLLIGFFALAGGWMQRALLPQPQASAWQTDFDQARVSLDEFTVMNGRLPISNLAVLSFAPAQTVTWLGDQSPVIVTQYAEHVRAYPLAILVQHPVVNDQLGDMPIAVTFCSLCNSPMVFIRQVDEVTLEFAASGMVRNGGLVMWDAQTQSWWQQFTGEALVGAYSGTRLKVLHSQVVGFSAYRRYYPDGAVLEGQAGINYERTPYIGYDSNPAPLLMSAGYDGRLPATERVLAAQIGGQAIAYRFSDLARLGAVNDRVQGVDVVALWIGGACSVQDNISIHQGRDVGMAMLFERAIGTQTLTFRAVVGGFLDEQTGSMWNIFGEATAGALRGTRLQTVEAFPYFWFAWAAAHPATLLR